jgi:hypothetical protein
LSCQRSLPEGNSPRSLDELTDLDRIGETDDELVRTTIQLRKWLREKLTYMKVDTNKNIEDLVDEALREYVERHD